MGALVALAEVNARGSSTTTIDHRKILLHAEIYVPKPDRDSFSSTSELFLKGSKNHLSTTDLFGDEVVKFLVVSNYHMMEVQFVVN